MSEIGIIGANGYIGRHVAHEIIQRGHDTILYDIHEHSIDGHRKYLSIDLRRYEKMPAPLAEHKFIFFMAGLTGSSMNPEMNRHMIETNEIALLNVLEFLREKEVTPKIIFPSTRLVYKGQKEKPLKEDDKKEFKTLYAITKFSGEHYLEVYQNLAGIRYTIFRICVPYGNIFDDSLSYGTLNHFLAKATRGEPVVIFGTGEQKRSLIHIQDLAVTLINGGFSEKTDNDIFNISGPDVLSIREIAVKIANRYGVSVEQIPWPDITRKIESGDTIFDSSKLERILKYRYQFSFDCWLKNLEK